MNLGSTESEILVFLASGHDGYYIQQIQDGLNRRSYRPVRQAVGSLESKGLIEMRLGVSEKKTRQKHYWITEKGVAFLFAHPELGADYKSVVMHQGKNYPNITGLWKIIEAINKVLGPGFLDEIVPYCGRVYMELAGTQTPDLSQFSGAVFSMVAGWMWGKGFTRKQIKKFINELRQSEDEDIRKAVRDAQFIAQGRS